METSLYDEKVIGKAYDRQMIKRLLVYVAPYRTYTILAVMLLLVLNLIQLAGPYLVKIAIDQYIPQKNMAGLRWMILFFMGVIIMEALLQFGQSVLLEWLAQKVMADLRLAVFSHLQRLPMSYFDRNPVGRLVTRVTTDVDTLNEVFTSGLITILGDIFTVIGIVVIMIHMNWQLALVTLSVLPFLIGFTFLIRTRLRDGFRAVRVRIAKINAFLQENITGMTTVQVFNRQAHNFQKFDFLNQSHRDAHLRTSFYFALFFPLVELMLSLTIALIIWYAGPQIVSRTLTLGSVVAFIQYVERFFRPLSDLGEKYNVMQAAMASAERIFLLLDVPPAIQSPPQPRILEPFQGRIEFRQVWFKYPTTDHEPDAANYVLQDISFEVPPGQKIAIVGATGSGKTTIINLLTRFYELNQGAILLDGVDIREFDLSYLRTQIGIVLQDGFIFAKDITSNIRLGNTQISEARVIQAAEHVNLAPFIETLPARYAEPLTERGSAISAGQRQLLAFARALAYNPKILVLDEATANVDPHTENLIQQALQHLLEQRTAIIIAHRLTTIQHVDKIIVLHKGKIRQVGTHAELLGQEGIYRRLYALQYTN